MQPAVHDTSLGYMLQSSAFDKLGSTHVGCRARRKPDPTEKENYV